MGGVTAPDGPVTRRRFLKVLAFVTGAVAFVLSDLKPGTRSGALAKGSALSTGRPSPAAAATAKSNATPKPTPEPEFPVAPYISKAIHLDPLTWQAMSFYKQPWRGYLETVSGVQFLAGIGINYQVPTNTNHAAVMKLLADSGFKSLRLEIGWNSVDWNETTLNQIGAYQTVFAACKRYRITPVILLNGNAGGPCPSKGYTRIAPAGGQLGATHLQLDSVADLVAGYSGISNLTGYVMSDVLFSSIDAASRTVQLSKPLPKPLAAGTAVRVDTLKYLPLYPTGTPQFEQTIGGWLRYVGLVLDQLRAAGITDAEFEVWNEMTFGSRFLSINNYYQPAIAQFRTSDPLKAGGQCWELGRRTAQYVKSKQPSAKVIWGFSNTSFFHTPIVNLPPGMDAQSYHPYGTNKRVIPKDFPPHNRYPLVIERYIPTNLVWCMPEGWAHLGSSLEYIMRLINPWNRVKDVPPGTGVFRHYMTEHGFSAADAGISERNAALQFKAKSAIRALLFWLNKGITKLDFFAAYDTRDQGMGLLFAQPAPKDYSAYVEQQLMSPALQAIKNVVAQFGGAQPLGQVRQLAVDVTSIGGQPKVFNGDGGHPPLYYREMFTFLPYQVSARKFVCAIYVMAYDITKPPPAMDFRLRIRNVNGVGARVSLYDPILNKAVALKVIDRSSSQITVRLQALEYPRLLVINE